MHWLQTGARCKNGALLQYPPVVEDTATMKDELKAAIEQLVDYLLPELTPAESAVYLYLLRHSFLVNGTAQIRVGKRTIAAGYGKGSRGERTNFQHMGKILKGLESKGCIRVADTNREGTLYILNLPKEVPVVTKKLAHGLSDSTDTDYFSAPERRREVFERDHWTCQYCGEKVAPENATLDHFLPQRIRGKHNKENLRTCCLICNSIKSGKTYEEAAAYLLNSIRERRERSQ